MNVYVVCMDSYYVRDAQMFDPERLSEMELNETDIFSETLEMHWHDIDAIPFIGVVKAISEEEACRSIANRYRYDARCLFATKIE